MLYTVYLYVHRNKAKASLPFFPEYQSKHSAHYDSNTLAKSSEE